MKHTTAQEITPGRQAARDLTILMAELPMGSDGRLDDHERATKDAAQVLWTVSVDLSEWAEGGAEILADTMAHCGRIVQYLALNAPAEADRGARLAFVVVSEIGGQLDSLHPAVLSEADAA